MSERIEDGDGGQCIVPPDDRRCTATASRTGARCLRWAIAGGSVCPMHGGSIARVKAAAQRRVAEAQTMAAFERWELNGDGAPVDVVAELTRLVSVVTSFQVFTEARLRALTGAEWAAHGPRVGAELGMFERACDRTRRLLRDVAELGLVEKAIAAQARISESQGAMLHRKVCDILTDLGHDVRDPGVRAVCAARFGELIEQMNTAADG